MGGRLRAQMTHLLAIDYYSHLVEICIVAKKVDKSETTVKRKKVFSRLGIPDILFSDKGPQFDSQSSETVRRVAVWVRELIATNGTIELRGR